MNHVLRSPVKASPIAAAYAKDGCFFPYDVISESEAAELLADLEAAEAEVAGDRGRLSMLRSFPAQLLPSSSSSSFPPSVAARAVAPQSESTTSAACRVILMSPPFVGFEDLIAHNRTLRSRRYTRSRRS